MAICRVYLFTYKRNHLLSRALHSLINQTFKDWVCELHNDCPDDSFPEKLVAEIGDPRVKVHTHPANLGPTASFNLAFSNVEEPYISLLEDDNWWNKDFLETMISVLNNHPSASLAWCNMKCWQEKNNNEWVDTGENIREQSSDLIFYKRLVKEQMTGAIHSNGAMLVRGALAGRYKIPNATWFDFVESIRERAFDYPIVYVPQVLANFSLTLSTSRTVRKENWNAWQIMLKGSFIKYSKPSHEDIITLWKKSGSGKLKSSHHLILACFFYPQLRKFLRYASFSDWSFFIAYYFKHPVLLVRTIRCFNQNTLVKEFIDLNTAIRFRQDKGL